MVHTGQFSLPGALGKVALVWDEESGWRLGRFLSGEAGRRTELTGVRYLGGGLVPIVWVLATVLLWRETPAERLARMSNLVTNPTVLCPVCGYNLSGLREARISAALIANSTALVAIVAPPHSVHLIATRSAPPPDHSEGRAWKSARRG